REILTDLLRSVKDLSVRLASTGGARSPAAPLQQGAASRDAGRVAAPEDSRAASTPGVGGHDDCVSPHSDQNQPGVPPGRPPQQSLASLLPEVGTEKAGRILGVSKDTVLQLRAAGVLPYRNIAPPGSTRPVYRFPLADVLRVRQDYQIAAPPQPRT